MGLVSRVLEREGLSTVALSMIPPLTAATGAPRVAAIELPFSRPMGGPDMPELQRGVLAAALAVLETAPQPGTVVHLPFEWPGDPRRARIGPSEPPPIVRLLLRKPWMALRLLSGELPPHGPAELSGRETPPTFSRK